MQTLLKPFVFFLLLTKGTSLECDVCADIGTSCTGNKKVCREGQDTCVIVFLESTLNGKVLQTVMKGCGSSDTCNSPPKHLNMGRGKSIRTSLTCCIGEACANSTPPVPRVESKTNGKQCPSCYSSSGTCITEMVNCTGSERYCFDVFSRSNADSRARDMIMKGCTTKSACESINKGVPLIWEENNAVIIKAKCTPDPSRGTRSSGLLLPTFSGLLLLKILL
ncbi:phospholipase A2 inhibitor NAI-like isoform X3 [Rhineura floridana]|nr:phospholipase A2 inhibitor NAI-like isoform X3 [Rhineura floridana]